MKFDYLFLTATFFLTACGAPAPGLIQIVGPTGARGADGSNCKVTDTPTGALIECEGSEAVEVKDGAAGEQGLPGVNGAPALLETIDPCGDHPSVQHEEVLLRMGAPQGLYAVYYDHSAKLAFLVKLQTGSYVTTDGTGCQFQVSLNGDVVY